MNIKLRRWLKPSDVKDGDIVTIIGEGQERSANETPFRRAVFEMPVRLQSGEERTWTMNRTTQRRCVEAWGNETKNWIGKKIRIELRKQNVKGVIKTVIYGVPITDKLDRATVGASEIENAVTLTLTLEEANQLEALLLKIGKQLESRRHS